MGRAARDVHSGFPLYFDIKIQSLFKDPAVAILDANLQHGQYIQQYLISIYVITGQF